MERVESCKVVGTRRGRPAMLSPAKRIRTDEEVEAVFTLDEAVAEARRCTASNPCYTCEVCELICPDLAITRDPETHRIRIDLDYCKGCALCAHYCPHGAITMVVDD
jgi:2-oxoacid:acceptor oxidoreductase delta subunit (pyruvate/2-ketoisovalerate family)